MEAVAIVVLGVLALALAAALVWALTTRGKVERDAVAARTELESVEARHADALASTTQAAEREAARLTAERDEARAQAEESSRRVLTLSEERARLAEQVESLTAEIRRTKTDFDARLAEERERLETKFTELSSKALDAQTKRFLERVNEKLDTNEKLSKAEYDQRRKAFEQAIAPFGAKLTELDKHLHATGASATALREETGKLVRALSRPEVRGRYGEIQLRRVAELAGMVDYCDFTEQTTARDNDGSILRPDMVVQLPNERVIAVDAKCNIDAYIAAVNAADESEREGHLERFARHVAEQAKKLGDKKYWAAFEHSPEFVVMFVPGDHFIDAALSRRPDLLEAAATQGVIMASPSTLIGLLRAVAVGWREHTFSQEAKRILALGVELHKRSGTLLDHFAAIGTNLGRSIDSYNKAVGSVERSLLPQLRRFEEAGASSAKQLAEPKPVEATPRDTAQIETPPAPQELRAASET